MRLKWWRVGEPGSRWRDVAWAPNDVVAQLPDAPLPTDGLPAQLDIDPRPILFGHYWERRPLPVFTPRHACVDASVAKGGCLAAYRFNGERELKAEGFVYE